MLPEQYRDWMATHVFTQNDARLFEQHMAGWARLPRFHLVLVQEQADTQALARSIQSLAKQYYPHLTITVVARVAAPTGMAGGRLQWLEVHANEVAAANRSLLSVDADWFGLLRAGDEIAPHALLVAAEGAHSHPAWQMMYSDEDRVDADGTRSHPRFKPDFDIELLRAAHYLGGLMLIRNGAWKRIDGWAELPRGQDELVTALRIAEHYPTQEIGHLDDVLYHRCADDPALLPLPQEIQAEIVTDHLRRCGSSAAVMPGLHPETLRVAHHLDEQPRVSVIIPTKDQLPLLQRCISSLFEMTDYPDFEVIVVDNGSSEADAIAYLQGISQLNDPRLKVITYAQPFNFSAMNNLAASQASGELLLLLNNDTAAVHRDWLANMVSLTQLDGVGAVGARLLYPNGSIQHAGVVLGMTGPAEHLFIDWPADADSPFHLLHACHMVSVVTAACMLIKRDLYLELGGMDEQAFKVSYNDVDLCLKIKQADHRILWTPYATLLHEGSASQNKAPPGTTDAASDKLKRFAAEQDSLYAKWMPALARDSAYNRNLGLCSRDYEIEPEPVLSWNPTPWRPLPRVLVYPADFSGSGEVRVLAPRRALDARLLIRGFASMRQLYPTEITRADVDSVVMQRPINHDRVKLFKDHKRYSRAKCIVEIDDLINAIPFKSPHFGTIDKQALAYFDEAAALADCLLVSTHRLAEAFAHLNENVRVLPNYLDGSQWLSVAASTAVSNRPRVGWAGSVSHAGDLDLVFPVIKSLAKEVDWIFMGACPSSFKPYVKEIRPAVTVAGYPRALADMALDLAIAPLEINAFNEAKSHLKLLEYGALGYPVICTDIEPYRGKFPVTRVANKPKLWIEAIRDHIHDRSTSGILGKDLKNYVLGNWLLDDHLDEWVQAWLP